MRVAVLSGKGGTGKTTVSTNISLSLNAFYIDADVEEPDGFLFLNPKNIKKKDVMISYPQIDDKKCVMCGKCIDACGYNALINIKKDIILFSKLCHGCEVCSLVCNHDAIIYGKRVIGTIEEGISDKGITCRRGLLNIGEPLAVPVIRDLLSDIKEIENGRDIVVDCPPGTSCNVVNTLRNVDSAILVTEPTRFGLHDLDIAINVVKKFNIPFGVIVNRDDPSIHMVDDYCNENNINIIGRIPYSRDIASRYSNGLMLYDDKNYKKLFDDICINAKGVLKWS